MEDSEARSASQPPAGRFVTQSELIRVLDDCLWQVERRRVEPRPVKASPAAPAE